MTRKTTAYARSGRRYLAVNPIRLAINNATKLVPEELRQVIDPARAALDALRTGRATPRDVSELITAASVAISIEHKGVVKGLSEPLHEADVMLYDITQRATANGPWKSPTLYASEIVALAELLRLHEFQLQQLSFRELREAKAHAAADTVRRGGTVIAGRTVEVV